MTSPGTQFTVDTTSLQHTASSISSLSGTSTSTAGELATLALDALSFAQIGSSVGAANTSLHSSLEQALTKVSKVLSDVGTLVGVSSQGYAADDQAIAKALGGTTTTPATPTAPPATTAPGPATDGDKYVDDFMSHHKQGDTGVAVKQFQNELKQLGYNPGTSDGQWGPATQQAADAYAAAHHYTTGLSGTAIDLPGQLGVVNAPNAQAATAVRAALSQTGVTYVYGGKAHDSALDCSGLTKYAYGQAGITLPEKSTAQDIGMQVQQADLAPGDLAVWDGHVAMYIGQDKMVEAPHTGEHVHISDLRTSNAGDRFLGFYRPSVPATTK